MADQDGCHSELIMQLLRHVTSSLHDADVKEYIFRRTGYPPSLVVIAFIFSELCMGAGIRPVEKKPGFNRVNLLVQVERWGGGGGWGGGHVLECQQQ